MEVRIRKSGVDGLYYIKFARGTLPPVLKQSFASWRQAERALIKYLKSKERVLFKAVYPAPQDYV